MIFALSSSDEALSLFDIDSTKMLIINNQNIQFFQGFKILTIFENVCSNEEELRIKSQLFYLSKGNNHYEYIGKKEWMHKFIFISTPEEECISKIFNSSGELLAYDYYDKNNKYHFCVATLKSRTSLNLFTMNCSFEELQQSIREMEIRKLEETIPYECGQRKSEIMLIIHAYQIIGKKEHCYIMAVNNHNQIYEGKDTYCSYFNSSKFRNIPASKMNSAFISELGLTTNQTQGIAFIILPLKLYHHAVVLVISLEDENLYLLDSCYDENKTKEIFGKFRIIPLIEYTLQLDATCAYFMEAMCIVLSQYRNISEIKKDCQNGIFVVKTFAQIGQMFQPSDNCNVIIPYYDNPYYQKITINVNRKQFIYGLKKDLSNQKFFNFAVVLDYIDPESHFPNKIAEIKKLNEEFDNNFRIKQIMDKFYVNIDPFRYTDITIYDIKKKNESEKYKLKDQFQNEENKSQLKNKGVFGSVMCLNDYFKKQKSSVMVSIEKSNEDTRDEIE